MCNVIRASVKKGPAQKWVAVCIQKKNLNHTQKNVDLTQKYRGRQEQTKCWCVAFCKGERIRPAGMVGSFADLKFGKLRLNKDKLVRMRLKTGIPTTWPFFAEQCLAC